VSEVILNYILLFVLLELFEVQTQKASNIFGVLARLYEHYKKSIFLALLLNPTFIFALIFAMLSDLNPYALMLLSIKGADLLTKLLLTHKVFVQKAMSIELSFMLLFPIKEIYFYLGVLIYPVFIYLALYI